jgi:hypothetical protein
MTFVSACVLVCGFVAVTQGGPAIEVPQYPVPEDNAWDYMVRAGYLAHQTDRSAANALYNLQDREPTPDELHQAAEAYQPAFVILREGLYLPCRVPEILLPPLEPIVPPEPVLPPAPVVMIPPQAGEGEMQPQQEEYRQPAWEQPPPLEWVEESLASGEWSNEQGFQVFAWVRELSRGLMWEARSRVADGHPDEALDSVQDGLRMGRNLSINGTIIHQLVSTAINAITAKSLDHVLSAGEPSAERLIAFARWNEQNRAEMQPLSATVALEWERHQRWMREVVAPTEDEYTAEVIAWADQPAHSRGALHDPPWEGHQLTLGSTGTWTRMTQKLLMMDAGLAGMSVRCAVQAYRQREGVYPRTLTQLASDYLAKVPRDPCSGEAFRYVLTRLDGTGAYALYSVGPDGDDDGGKLVFNREDGDGDILIGPTWRIYGIR